MKNKITFLIGILGVSLFVVSSIVGGILIENYSLTEGLKMIEKNKLFKNHST